MRKKVQVVMTEDLILRPFQISDAPAMFQNWAQDPEVTTWQPWKFFCIEMLDLAKRRGWDYT